LLAVNQADDRDKRRNQADDRERGQAAWLDEIAERS
jgi:hypothetical protein